MYKRQVHLYIVGTKGDRQVRVTRRGTVERVKLSDNRDNGFTDYAIPLAARGNTELRLPYMSGRTYVALGHKLKFKAVRGADGNVALQHPAGWVESDEHGRPALGQTLRQPYTARQNKIGHHVGPST